MYMHIHDLTADFYTEVILQFLQKVEKVSSINLQRHLTVTDVCPLNQCSKSFTYFHVTYYNILPASVISYNIRQYKKQDH